MCIYKSQKFHVLFACLTVMALEINTFGFWGIFKYLSINYFWVPR